MCMEIFNNIKIVSPAEQLLLVLFCLGSPYLPFKQPCSIIGIREISIMFCPAAQQCTCSKTMATMRSTYNRCEAMTLVQTLFNKQR